MAFNIGTTRQKMNDLMGQRAEKLKAAQEALDSGNRLDYQARLKEAQGFNAQIDDLQAMVAEYDKYDIAHAPVYGDGPKNLEEMGKALAAHERVAFQPRDVLEGLVTPLAGVRIEIRLISSFSRVYIANGGSTSPTGAAAG